ncbi:MAG: hypothetical protein A3G81_28900 [Betaproteobacteria bacterium RIFCSPLOWO2_12_FULL_65_14]|nr:MAG: hypothetical protein A3G81_28900 [Betaproteobacteria bacterium RIFCSPLOWO2_12_FULL_65_14]
MDDDTATLDVARYFLEFLTNESRGKCVPCREGMRQTLKVLTNITNIKGSNGDIARLEDLSDVPARPACSRWAGPPQIR